MDDLYRDYVNRVVRMTLPESYRTQVQNLQPSPKFKRDETGTIQVSPFPGYTVMTPPWQDESQNQSLYKGLGTFQQTVGDRLPEGVVAMVPPSSFHMTLADLIWESNYRLASESPDFAPKLHERMADSFNMYRGFQREEGQGFWQVLGLIPMPRAIAVCLAPKSEAAYNRVIRLRRAIYQNSGLMALGIEQQYHFTAHVTLGYFTDRILDTDRESLAQVFADLHQHWLDADYPKDFCVHRAELRQFEDMNSYRREPDWPYVEI